MNYRHWLGFEPAAFFHFFFSQRIRRAFLVREVYERAGFGFQAGESACDFPTGAWDKPVSHLARVEQFSAVIIADDDRIDGVIGNVAAHDEFLAFVDSVFEPGATSLTGFVMEPAVLRQLLKAALDY